MSWDIRLNNLDESKSNIRFQSNLILIVQISFINVQPNYLLVTVTLIMCPAVKDELIFQKSNLNLGAVL